jgi:ribosomal protein L14
MYHFLSNNCCILLKYVQVNTMKKNFTPNTNTIITYKNIVFLSILFYYIMIFKVSYLKDFYNSLAVKAVCKGFQISLKCVAVETAKYQFNFQVSRKVANSKIHSPVLLKALTNKGQVAGTYVKFSKPGCALLKNNNQPLANIVHGVFYGEYRPQDHLKSVSSKPYYDNMPIIKLFLILIIYMFSLSKSKNMFNLIKKNEVVQVFSCKKHTQRRFREEYHRDNENSQCIVWRPLPEYKKFANGHMLVSRELVGNAKQKPLYLTSDINVKTKVEGIELIVKSPINQYYLRWKTQYITSNKNSQFMDKSDFQKFEVDRICSPRENKFINKILNNKLKREKAIFMTPNFNSQVKFIRSTIKNINPMRLKNPSHYNIKKTYDSSNINDLKKHKYHNNNKKVKKSGSETQQNKKNNENGNNNYKKNKNYDENHNDTKINKKAIPGVGQHNITDDLE